MLISGGGLKAVWDVAVSRPVCVPLANTDFESQLLQGLRGQPEPTATTAAARDGT